MTSGFRSEVDENYALLGHYAASIGNLLPTFRDNISVPSSRVQNLKENNSLPLKKGPIGCPETSVGNYHYSMRNDTEEHSSLLIYSNLE